LNLDDEIRKQKEAIKGLYPSFHSERRNIPLFPLLEGIFIGNKGIVPLS
jgi:hypothetical protein